MTYYSKEQQPNPNRKKSSESLRSNPIILRTMGFLAVTVLCYVSVLALSRLDEKASNDGSFLAENAMASDIHESEGNNALKNVANVFKPIDDSDKNQIDTKEEEQKQELKTESIDKSDKNSVLGNIKEAFKPVSDVDVIKENEVVSESNEESLAEKVIDSASEVLKSDKIVAENTTTVEEEIVESDKKEATESITEVQEVKNKQIEDKKEVEKKKTTNEINSDGLSTEEAEAKAFIYNSESGNRPDAVNPKSGACGLGQALPCSKMDCSLNDYECQDKWFTNYCKKRYGSWVDAVNHWKAKVPIAGKDVGHWW